MAEELDELPVFVFTPCKKCGSKPEKDDAENGYKSCSFDEAGGVRICDRCSPSEFYQMH